MQVNFSFKDLCRKFVLSHGDTPGSFFLFTPSKMRVFLKPKSWVTGVEDTFDKALSWIEEESVNKEVAVSFSYDALHKFEKVPAPEFDPYGIPSVIGVSHGVIIEIADHNVYTSIDIIKDDSASAVKLLEDSINVSLPQVNQTSPLTVEELTAIVEEHSNVSRKDYEKNVLEIKDLIKEGEVYQVNLSHQISLPFNQQGSILFSKIIERDPPSYGGLINDPLGEWSIVSASPEGYLEGKDDGSLLAKPIKGTRKTGDTIDETDKLSEDLLSSSKDHAELSMIVDLIRNDLSRVCEVGSVEVLNHARLEHHGTVMHLVSDVIGTRRKDIKLRDILSALFPSGSVTGAPKIAAMKEISRFERSSRGPYTGSFGSVGPNKNVSLSVAIRTGLLKNGEFRFQVGGGIVIDSSPKEEYLETVHKARVIVEALERVYSAS